MGRRLLGFAAGMKLRDVPDTQEDEDEIQSDLDTLKKWAANNRIKLKRGKYKA